MLHQNCMHFHETNVSKTSFEFTVDHQIVKNDKVNRKSKKVGYPYLESSDNWSFSSFQEKNKLPTTLHEGASCSIEVHPWQL